MNRQGSPVRIRHRIAFTLWRMTRLLASFAESASGIRSFISAHSSSLISSNNNLAPITFVHSIPTQTPTGV